MTPFALAFMAEVKKGKKQQIDVLRFLTRDLDIEDSSMASAAEGSEITICALAGTFAEDRS